MSKPTLKLEVARSESTQDRFIRQTAEYLDRERLVSGPSHALSVATDIYYASAECFASDDDEG